MSPSLYPNSSTVKPPDATVGPIGTDTIGSILTGGGGELNLTITKVNRQGNRQIDYYGVKLVVQAADWKAFQKAVRKA